jgi:hypothetical protein
MQQGKQQTAQDVENRGSERQPQRANRPTQQRKPAAQSEYQQMRSEQVSQSKAKAPRSFHSGKRPQSE